MSSREAKLDGSELTSYMLLYGYRHGAFPMTLEDGSIGWFQPRMRALFPIGGIHVSQSLAKFMRQKPFEITFDTCFEQVMRSCMRPSENWISESLIRAYTSAHYEGWGHSIECWDGEELVGGVYGLAIGTCFFAESMFHRRTNASKIALGGIVNKCRSLGFTLFDAQVMSPHLKSLGAYDVPHTEYMKLLHGALQHTTCWSPRLL